MFDVQDKFVNAGLLCVPSVASKPCPTMHACFREFQLRAACSNEEFLGKIQPRKDQRVSRIAVSLKSSVGGRVSRISLIGDSLYKRISEMGDPNLSMFTVLQQWINEGRG